MKRILCKIVCLGVILSMEMSSVSAVFVKAEGKTSRIYGEKVCGLVSPLGIDETPVFSWVVDLPGEFSKVQDSYRIRVSTTEQKSKSLNADVWDSGTVLSDETTSVKYSGSKLSSKTHYYWTVQSTVDSETVSSGVNMFSTGMADESEWQGKWIGSKSGDYKADLENSSWIWLAEDADPGRVPGGKQYFRKSFQPDASKTVESFTIAFTADDNAKLYLNSAELGGSSLWMDGQIIDATDYLVSGKNTIAFEAENEKEGYAGLAVKLKLQYTDSTSQVIVSDTGFKVSKDWRDGWQKNEFDDSGWKAPDQAVKYGADPWKKDVKLKAVGERAEIMLRKEFSVEKQVESADVYICGLGFFNLTVNGKAPDDSVLNPFITQYDKSVLYRTFDVTELLNRGENAIGVELGNSFYNETVNIWNWDTAAWRDDPKLRLNMVVKYSDGSVTTLASDESWKLTRGGPITSNSLYYGDTYDARLEKAGFDTAGFDDGSWSAASEMSAPSGKLKAQMKAPVKRTGKYSPSDIKEQKSGTYVVSSPEMVSGWINLKGINAQAGDKITLTYGQKLNADGSVVKWGAPDGISSGGFSQGYTQQDNYICKGTGNESYEPTFSYKGFRYVQIDGLKTAPKAEDIDIYRVSNDVELISSFETSDSMINELHKMMYTSVANNFQGEHCDPMIEKNGWLGDVNVSLDSMMYNYDMPASLPEYIDVMQDGFEMYGIVPVMVPNANWGVNNYPVWNSLFVNGVGALEKYFGTDEYSKQQYDVMKEYVTKQISIAKGGGWVWEDGGLADWVSPIGGTDPNASYNETASEGAGIVATGYLYAAIKYVKELADSLGKTEDAKFLSEALSNIYDAFNKKFFNKEKQIYETTFWSNIGTRTKYRQTSNLVALQYGLVPEEYIEPVVSNLVNDIKEKDYHLDTGCVGTKLILPILSDYGYQDIAYRILTQKTYPSWGYCLETNGVSTWEMWENSSRSLDHYFLGTYDEWFFSGLAGIRDIEDGYKTFSIKPGLANELSYVKSSVETNRGTVASEWRVSEDGSIDMFVKVPVGSEAKLVLPTNRAAGITVNSKEAQKAEGVKSINTSKDNIELTVGSGEYNIITTCTDRLKSEIRQTRDINKMDYESKAFDTFLSEVNNAKAALNNHSGTQKEIESARSRLALAKTTLEENILTERVELRQYVQNLSENINPKNYITKEYSEFELSKAKAEKLLADPSAQKSELAQQLEQLKTAAKKLGGARVGNLAINAKVTASSSEENENWGLSKLTDADRKNNTEYGYLGWSSSGNIGVSHTEWIKLDLMVESVVGSVVIYPSMTETSGSNSCYGFPEDFTISVSDDAENWKTVVSKTGYPLPGYGALEFAFEPQTARYIKFEGTKLRQKPSDGDSYRIQLAEFEAYNTSIEDGLTETGGGTYYYKSGFPVTDQTRPVDGAVYYFGVSGVMAKNAVVTIDREKYYFKADGKRAQSEFYTYAGKTYFAGADGKRAISEWVFNPADSKSYYMDKTGHKAVNMFIDGIYFVGGDGARITNQILTINSNDYIFAADSKLLKGNRIVEFKGGKYYVGAGGVIKKNAYIGGGYLFGSGGKMLGGGLYKIGGKTYIVAKDKKASDSGFYGPAGKCVLYIGGAAVKGTKLRSYKGKKYLIEKGYASRKTKVISLGSKKYYVKNGVCKTGGNRLVRVGKKSYVIDKNSAVKFSKKKNLLVSAAGSRYIAKAKSGYIIKYKKTRAVKASGKTYIIKGKTGRVIMKKIKLKVSGKVYKIGKLGAAKAA